jgi:hypothetical protein
LEGNSLFPAAAIVNRGVKRNPIRRILPTVGRWIGFFVHILGREVYPDVTKSNREAQQVEQAPLIAGLFLFSTAS